MSDDPVRVATLGIGWWSGVLADAVQRTPKLEIVSCFTRSEAKRQAFAQKYGCNAVDCYEDMLQDDAVEAILNTTPNHMHRETTVAAAGAGRHTFLDKPIAHTLADAQSITQACREAGVVLSVGYQRRREPHFRWIRQQIDAGKFGKLVQAEANISRDREGVFDLTSWRYQAEGMPGGVMLQIGIHYTDVLSYLMGPISAVSARTSQLVLPGDNPDVATFLLEHTNGALSTLAASYASASEYYLMNIYGKEATAYYTLFDGLRYLTRGDTAPVSIACEKNDTIVEELEEFADCIRGTKQPEIDGDRATESLAVIRAGVQSMQENRRVDVAEVLEASRLGFSVKGKIDDTTHRSAR
ncbi:MAG: Gfo/Idh/MocA family oxidoreductase [Candidatus Tectomicrobia bacterium]